MRRLLPTLPLMLLLSACRGSGSDTWTDSSLPGTDSASVDDTDTEDTEDTEDTDTEHSDTEDTDTEDTGDTDTDVEPPTGSPELLNPNVADVRQSTSYTLQLTLGDPITAERSSANYTLRLGAGTMGLR